MKYLTLTLGITIILIILAITTITLFKLLVKNIKTHNTTFHKIYYLTTILISIIISTIAMYFAINIWYHLINS